MVIRDDHAGLVNAIDAVLPGAAGQRCRAHYHRNLLTCVPKTTQPGVSTLVRTIFEQPDKDPGNRPDGQRLHRRERTTDSSQHPA